MSEPWREPYKLTESRTKTTTDLMIAHQIMQGNDEHETAEALNRNIVGGPYGAKWSGEFVLWAMACQVSAFAAAELAAMEADR